MEPSEKIKKIILDNSRLRRGPWVVNTQRLSVRGGGPADGSVSPACWGQATPAGHGDTSTALVEDP